MKLAWSNTRALIAGAALVIVSNAIALGGVAYNRSGEPDSVLQLTEREIPIQYWSWPDNENSAIHLELRWRVLFDEDEQTQGVQWLTPEKLRQLGFDMPDAGTTPDERQRLGRQPAREVLLALEYDGPAYQSMLARAHEKLREAEANLAMENSEERRANVRGAKALVENEQRRMSRLFVVAADRDAEALRQRYPDRKHYAIVRGRIDLWTGVDAPAAQIDGIETDTIRVPYAYRTFVEPYVRDRYYNNYNERDPRYSATVQFGRRLEPWIVQLSRM